MNRKGQITLDFLLALVGAIIFIQIFQNYSSEFINASRATVISNEGEAIALDLGQIAQLSLAFKDGNLEVQTGIPYIYDVNKLTGQDCNISFVDKGAGSTPRYFLYFSYEQPDFNKVIIARDLNFMPSALINQKFSCGSDFNFLEKKT